LISGGTDQLGVPSSGGAAVIGPAGLATDLRSMIAKVLASGRNPQQRSVIGVHMMMRRVVPAGLSMIALAVALAACSGGGAGIPSSGGDGGSGATPPVGTGAAGSTPGATSIGAVTGHVGDKLTSAGGDVMGGFDATLVKVFDHATPISANEEPLPPGARWVGVEFIFESPGSVDQATPVSLIYGVTSDGSTVTTDDVYQGFSHRLQGGFQGCTEAKTDVAYTYCTAFVVPEGQTLAQVGLHEVAGNLAVLATWTVP